MPPTATCRISWRSGPRRAVLPIVVHCIAAAAVMCLAIAQHWAWLLFGVVLASACSDGLKLRRELGGSRTLTMQGGVISIDGVDGRVERGWLGPGWTVIWLRLPNRRREMVSVFRSELTGADHAALRRHLKEFDFR